MNTLELLEYPSHGRVIGRFSFLVWQCLLQPLQHIPELSLGQRIYNLLSAVSDLLKTEFNLSRVSSNWYILFFFEVYNCYVFSITRGIFFLYIVNHHVEREGGFSPTCFLGYF